MPPRSVVRQQPDLRNLRRLIPLLLLTALVGCGGDGKMAQVSGTVKFSDGTPVTCGTVEFETVDQKPPVTATGEINSSGEFQLGTWESDDGVVTGKHRAVVVVDFEIGTGDERPGRIPKPTVHAKYREFETSGLEFTIEDDRPDLKIVVDRAQ